MMVEVGVERVEAAYRSIHARLWRALVAYTADGELASDAEAEAFAQVIRRGDDVDDVERWVWRAAFRIAAGMLADRRRATAPTSVELHEAATPVVEFVGLLHGLSAQQRACVTLRYVGRFTPSEIADLLDTTPGAVRVQLHRAHATLRESLGERERQRDV